MNILRFVSIKAATTILFAFCALSSYAQEGSKLSGTPIGATPSVDYATGSASTTVNIPADAFDGNFTTYYASYNRSFTWVGLELDQKYVITRVGWGASEGVGPARVQLGVFQGANEPDFSDALPIYLIPERGIYGQMLYADVNCSRGFKYVRYVGPNDSRCKIAELEFYGYPGEGDDNNLYQVTNLPLVVVNTPNMEWFHEDDKSYELNGSNIYIINEGKFDVNAPGQVRGRGNASWTFPKKPFRIKFDKKQKVLGGPAKAKKWTMINNYGDKTLMRNKVAFEMSSRIGMAFTPACHFVDLIFNGEYEGTYQLCDQIEANENRVNITEMEPEDIAGEALSGGYLIEVDGYAKNEPADEMFYSLTNRKIPVTIKEPDSGVSQQYNYIRNAFTRLDNSVFAYNWADPVNGYRRFLDTESFLKYFIIGELSGNTDTFWSTYMSLERGQDQFITGPCWDFDLAFDNDQRTYPINSASDFICFAKGSWANAGFKDMVTRIIKQDAGAKADLSYIWSYAREYQGFDYNTFSNLIEQYADDLRASQDLNFKRWPILNTYVHQNPRVFGTFDGEVNAMRAYLQSRFNKLDQLIGRVPVENGLSDVASDASIRVIGSTIVIADASAYTVCNLQGIVLATGCGDAQIDLPSGLYIVSTPAKTVKIQL